MKIIYAVIFLFGAVHCKKEPGADRFQENLDDLISLGKEFVEKIESLSDYNPEIEKDFGKLNETFHKVVEKHRNTVQKELEDLDKDVNKIAEKSTKRVQGDVSDIVKDIEKLVKKTKKTIGRGLISIVLDVYHLFKKYKKSLGKDGKSLDKIFDDIKESAQEVGADLNAIGTAKIAALPENVQKLIPKN